MPQLCELLGVQINWRKFKDNKLELCLRGNLAQYTLERMRRLLASGGREDTIHFKLTILLTNDGI